MTTLTSEEGTSERLLDDRIGPFLQQLRDAGYAEAYTAQEADGHQSLRPMGETEEDGHCGSQ